MIKSIERSSVHRITSGQVLIDLQTAVKELVENSLDAGATSIEVKFKDFGLKSFEVSDNGSGIAPEDYDNVAMKHCTSKLSTFEDLTTVRTFGFRGEALSSLCALSERVTIATATTKEAPMGTILEFDRIGKVKSRSGKVARSRGTTLSVEGLFIPLPVRRKEFERNSKREFGKALSLLSAYALVPCTKENKGVRLAVVHLQGSGRKSDQIRTDGKPSLRSSISSLWGPKQLECLAELNLAMEVVPEKIVLRRQGNLDHDGSSTKIQVHGLISKFSPGNGRTGPDRQFFFINGRPCSPAKIQKAFNEVYRSFNMNQSPFIVADFILPTDSCDINVSPDKRTILLHSENALVAALKVALEEAFAPARSTFVVQPTQTQKGTPKNMRSTVRTESSDNSTSALQDTVIEVQNDMDDVENLEEVAIPGVGEEHANIESVPQERSASVPRPLSDLHSDEEGRKVQSISKSDPPVRPTASGTASSSCSHPSSSSLPAPLAAAPSSSTRPRSPSPVPIPAQTLALSPKKPVARPVQMVLSTADAAWAMHPTAEEPVRKKRKLEPGKRATDSNPRAALRSQLSSFAAAGSERNKMLSDENEDGEREEMELVEDGNRSEEDAEEVDELAEEDEEMRIDPDADKPSGIISELDAGVEEPLFLPEPEDFDVPHHPIGSPPVKVEEIEMGVLEGTDDSSTLSTERSKNMRTLEQSSDNRPGSSSGISKATGASRSIVSEVVRTTNESSDVHVPCNLDRIDLAWGSLLEKHNISGSSKKGEPSYVDPSAGLSNTSDEISAERELSRIIDKEDFSSMEVIGQFNLGFIIARRRFQKNKAVQSFDENSQSMAFGADLDDLFIIDQHAADEKYNFETLQQTTKIESQRLFRARPLELTAADELLALENVDVLHSNGFEIEVDEEAKLSQGRVKLVAQPVSGSTDFDMKDLEELLHLMQDRPAGQMVRCSKARAMFAMRACRKSVMVGMALNKSQMSSVVRHMGTIDQPWNCPHGRPTMRHLISLNDTITDTHELVGPNARAIDWGNL
ncbi:hypothetical protein DFH11DRAFT_1512880 [Phellopilus nigrolimitatus]|nr:hypothetical protein DFH11DRAFT_1512880 [Phellopilus nigrolimitatus]